MRTLGSKFDVTEANKSENVVSLESIYNNIDIANKIICKNKCR